MLVGLTGPWGSDFSAVCWFFGRDMHKSTGYPIGLVSVNWGATTIETWMSPTALAKCADQKGFDRPYKPEPPSAAGCKHLGASCTVGSSNECCGGRCFYYAKPPLWPAGGYCDEKSPSNSNTQLFDNMITPLLSMTIRAVVWYQGESDVGNEIPSADDLTSKNYACMMPALVDDWRSRWSEASGTAPDFPFGIVQLSAWGSATGSTPATGYSLAVAATRWGQTANYGYAPNPTQPNTFMAVAVDLAAFEGGCCAGRTNCNTYPGALNHLVSCRVSHIQWSLTITLPDCLVCPGARLLVLLPSFHSNPTHSEYVTTISDFCLPFRSVHSPVVEARSWSQALTRHAKCWL